ncbi:PTS lactose/cellobiose transporter subunit IIA [Granulicatella adiacens ATCC 49175]|uniref:PTS system, Lactose/Cellobiose specific IIA subunit n=1 Tax=Granulicatella adiacens ATCC 49175 TaxID=638301 RepID=C8NG56_9LACT|nr:PTS lactose/cellobiose transporter subunit IIA [Granulicatella adiacens]EEW37542.1 PTS system, Lactose/Cellobiose specific IIA subunit [Granulicatella adiacens ATCC 49175]UAK93264.1 PTS lactose/cellobiose transporter subunit IIA [Granulicatella adiacens]UWP37742.1 PTS lactose/cellobiose transporter subunit IIA [Granulicatella adiacens ATCC 49175]
MSETKKADTQRLMQLIVKSSKVTTLAMQSVKSALAGDISSARGLLDEARAKGVEAHNVQTEMIQQEIRGEGDSPTLLSVHAQDHFMNSHLLLEVVDIIVNQQEQIETLKERITKLEQVGEMHE